MPDRSNRTRQQLPGEIMASGGGNRCEACCGGIGLWQAAFTSECAHIFHLRCVSGSAACPVCAARWSDAPATGPAPAPAPATPNPFWLSSAPPPPATQTPSCPVCHGAMGRGQATVTSECNHTFHLRCFSGTVCPVCGARWRDEVTVAPSQSPPPHPTSSPPLNPASSPPPTFGPQPPSSDTARPVFNDDEPVEHPLDARDTAQETASNRVLVLKTHCEHPAVARDSALDSFAVLVHAKGPAAASERAPLDLVTVLDVSGSMCGPKLELLKKAMDFVIDHLGPSDRLSIVIFSSNARRIIRLTRMSDGGKVSAKRAVESLATISTTNIGDGLRVAAEVLDGRRHRNPIASVILLSDGEDNHTLGCFQSGTGRTKSYIDLVPWSLRRSDDNRCAPPVHTFGFGTDHDAAAMHTIAEATGGTFSFIQNQAVLQDSFAQCIGGLLSVAVQEGRVAVECLHPGVRVRVVKSGRYGSRVDADGRAASVDVGELYADEERRFLVFLDVPVAAGDGAAEDGGGVTPLIKVSSTYKDAATGRPVDVSCEDASVRRPVVVADMEPCVEVARELFRVEAAEDIAAARAAAERGEHAKAARILDRRQEASAAAGLAGDERCAELVAELRELSARVADRREYEQTGRACLLAGMSSHAQQRASTVQLFASAAPSASPPFSAAAPAPRFGFCFATPAMQSMVESSRKAREQQQSEPGGSPFGPK
ncbi:E3 ubiquitin-protein ligase WAV3-like [Panicum virgatum]|uniref:E3 ubiquitin-protein ligase WAV3-like n=1 Tax=Panicum virgatum TaxID=38727 RepID=UPI0019D5FBEC|nr:E3 ubiquitin-protein ligase WAV3-like [Panicum virgatum]